MKMSLSQCVWFNRLPITDVSAIFSSGRIRDHPTIAIDIKLLLYIRDYLTWIPFASGHLDTYFDQPCIIAHEGLKKANAIFLGLTLVFSQAPDLVRLTPTWGEMRDTEVVLAGDLVYRRQDIVHCFEALRTMCGEENLCESPSGLVLSDWGSRFSSHHLLASCLRLDFPLQSGS